MSQDVTIGIDLGTSNSCVATVMGGRPQVLANAYGEPTTASVVAFGQDSSIAVGNQAKARVILDPQHTVSSAKRLIGRYFFSEEVKKARAVCSYEIVSGDTLGGIAKRYYGKASLYTRIHKANEDLIPDPNKIYPGQKIKIPLD